MKPLLPASIKDAPALIAGIFIIALLFIACNEQPSTASKNESAANEVKKHSVVQNISTNTNNTTEQRSYNRYYNDIGRYIAGLSPNPESVLDTALLNSKEWKNYAIVADHNWKKFDDTRKKALQSWSAQELKMINEKKENLFYPFSGPDILHGYTFFPTAKTYVLVGLEPVGECPVFNADSVDSLGRYINSIHKSLYAILNFSFFRTLSMKDDLNSKEISGVTPLLMIFLERTNTNIRDVRYISINDKGQLTYETDPGNLKHRGVEITFTAAKDTNDVKQLYYFSVDLSNSGLKKMPEFVTYINNLGRFNTYLKSASYLMHENYFSTIRTSILEHSDNLLQDDSGIPYRFFTADKWQTALYGSYTGVIPLFSNKHQKDLETAYRDSTHIKSLPFGIGYKYKLNQSNLLLTERKQK